MKHNSWTIKQAGCHFMAYDKDDNCVMVDRDKQSLLESLDLLDSYLSLVYGEKKPK